MEKKIRVLIAKPGLDGHDRGAKIVARALRDAGMEVIYTGLHQTADMIVETAVQEDVDVIGLSLLSGAHMTLFRDVTKLLKEKGMGDVLVVGGDDVTIDGGGVAQHCQVTSDNGITLNINAAAGDVIAG